MRIIIIGGGLGGLCLAQGLRKNGFDATLYEREGSLHARGQGYRLHINARGQAALHECLPENVWQAFVATCARPQPTFFVANEYLSRKFSVDIAKSENHTTQTTGSELVADRLTMRTILSSGLGETIHYDRQFSRFERTGDGTIIAHFADGSQEAGDVLIGADGINSVVRAQYLPTANLYDTELRSVFAKVPLSDEVTEAIPPMLLENLFSVVIGPTSRRIRALGRIPELIHLGLAGAPKFHCAIGPFKFVQPPVQVATELIPDVSLADTRDYLMVTFGARLRDMPIDDEEAASMTGQALKQMTLDMLLEATWSPAISALIERWDVDTVTYQAIRSSLPSPAWPPTNVTVMGDAIHAMSVTGGQGANTAYRDAAALVQALNRVRDGGELEREIGNYERAMREYGAAGIRESAKRGTRLVGQLPMPKH